MATGSAVLALAIIAGNAISFAALPLLARLYSPQDFGTFGFIISWTTILGVLFTLRYEAVIPITNSVDAACNLVRRSINRMLLYSAPLVGLLLIVDRLGCAPSKFLLVELLFGIWAAFAASYFAIGRAVHQRMDSYSIIATSTILRSGVFVGLAVLLAFMTIAIELSGSVALLLASVMSLLVPGLIYHATANPTFRRALLPGHKLVAADSNFSDAALRKVSTAFVLSQISFQLPLWIVMLLYGSAATGWVTMSYRLAMFPSDIICGSIALILARRIADSIFSHPERLRADRTLLALFLTGNFLLFGLLGGLIWLAAGPLLGPQWREAAPVMAMLASIGLSFTIQPIVIQILGLLKLEAQVLTITLTHIVLMLGGAALVAALAIDLTSAVFGLMLLEVLFSAVLTCYAMHVTRLHQSAVSVLT